MVIYDYHLRKTIDIVFLKTKILNAKHGSGVNNATQTNNAPIA